MGLKRPFKRIQEWFLSVHLDFQEFLVSSPPGAVDLYGASLLGHCHPQDAVEDARRLLRALLLLQLILPVQLRQETGSIHRQRWSYYTQERRRYLLINAAQINQFNYDIVEKLNSKLK